MKVQCTKCNTETQIPFKKVGDKVANYKCDVCNGVVKRLSAKGQNTKHLLKSFNVG